MAKKSAPASMSRSRASATGVPGRPLRADARRNRELIIETAFEAFASNGLSVPVHEIARLAGVGTGTVSRHFPTKESLFEAVFISRVERLIDVAQTLDRADDPAEAFFDFFTELVTEATANKGLAEALAGAGFDLDAVSSGEYNITGRMAALLRRAQEAGQIRGDVDIDDVKALVTSCLAREGSARDRMISIARGGLRA